MSEILVGRTLHEAVERVQTTDYLLESARGLAETALNKVDYQPPSQQNGCAIRKITLRHDDHTLFQIVKREIPGYTAGNL